MDLRTRMSHSSVSGKENIQAVESQNEEPRTRSTIITVMVVITWYTTNILVIIGNKFLLTNSGFRQPVFLTLCHMGACSLFGILVASAGWMPLEPVKSLEQLVRISVLAAIFCMSILLGNAALSFLPVSFFEAIGATTPFFTAVMAYLFQGARENTGTYLTLMPVIGGLIIVSCGGEPNFNTLGFVLALLAVAGRALKSVVQSMLMTDSTERMPPLSLLTYMSSVCVVMLLPFTLIMEPGVFDVVAGKLKESQTFFWLLAANASSAYFANLFNFLVTKRTSALTLQVLGNAKGVVATVVSVTIFANAVTKQGIAGYSLTVFGVMLYFEAKRRASSHAVASGDRIKVIAENKEADLR